MRRTILFVVIAVFAVMVLPVVGVGQPTSSQGGTPSVVFMGTGPEPELCNAKPIRERPVKMLPTAITVAEQSHVLVYFTGTLSHYQTPELVMTLQLKGVDSVQSSQQSIQRGGTDRQHVHSVVTLMWTFADVAPGDYTARAAAWLGGTVEPDGEAGVQACALTAFVMPVE